MPSGLPKVCLMFVACLLAIAIFAPASEAGCLSGVAHAGGRAARCAVACGARAGVAGVKVARGTTLVTRDTVRTVRVTRGKCASGQCQAGS